MIRYCYSVMRGGIGFKDDVAANLMDAPVAIATAERVD